MTDKVKVYEGSISLPTYDLKGEGPNPVFDSRYGVAHIYPYTLQLDIDTQIKDKQYHALYLENKYLKVTVLTGLGGRVYSVYDKLSLTEVFYKNSVVKFSPLAIRGAFFSGGVEFSFPVAHAPTTCDPINWEVQEHNNGSASISIGGIEHISRLRWTITLSLYPDRCALSQDVHLQNPTGIPGRYHYWTNASLDADEGTEFIYPFHRSRSYEYAGSASWSNARIDLIKDDPLLPGMEGVPMWPANNMQTPINFRWQKNMLAQVSIFGRDIVWDYFGAWQHSKNQGYAHVANSKDVSGMKLWSWGNMPVGVVNQTALTDDGSEYAETQCGAMETQLDFDFLKPYSSRKWREWWLPLREIGGLTCASELVGAKMTLTPIEGTKEFALKIAVCPVVAVHKSRIQIEAAEKILYDNVIDISPEQPWIDEVKVEAVMLADLAIQLSIFDQSGKPLLEYVNDRQVVEEIPEITIDTSGSATAQDYYLEAFNHENFDNRELAKINYQKAIEMDSEHKEAHFNFGLMLLRSAQYDLADHHLSKAQNYGNQNTYYFRGVIALLRDRLDKAEIFFDQGLNLSEYQTASTLGLGKIRLREKQFEQALQYFDKALELEPDSTIAVLLSAISLRCQGKTDAAESSLISLLSHDPINLCAFYELSKINSSNNNIWVEKTSRLLEDDYQYHIDLAAFYIDLGLIDDAIEVLISAWDKKPYAICAYMLAHLYDKVENNQLYQQWLSAAQKAPLDLGFPSRLEEINALNAVHKKELQDNNLKYLIGNFLYAHERFDKAVELWESANKELNSFDVLQRNLGVAYWERYQDADKAINFLEKALALNPINHDIYLYLDDLYKKFEMDEKRKELLSKINKLKELREDVRKRKILIMVDLGQNEEALEILENEEFIPLEMDQSFHDLYVRALMKRAEENLSMGNLDKAIQDYQLMLQYPKNLGVGRPTKRTQAKIYYLLGLAYEKAGKYPEAIESWQDASSEHHLSGEELFKFVQMSLDKVNRYSELGLS